MSKILQARQPGAKCFAAAHLLLFRRELRRPDGGDVPFTVLEVGVWLPGRVTILLPEVLSNLRSGFRV